MGYLRKIACHFSSQAKKLRPREGLHGRVMMEVSFSEANQTFNVNISGFYWAPYLPWAERMAETVGGRRLENHDSTC